jgi:amino acid adenylation domain-containing protein
MFGIDIKLPTDQQALRAQCFHPSGSFVEFKKEEVEQSIPSRFERRVSEGPDRIAVKSEKWRLSYAELNSLANRIARAILDRCREGSEPVALLLRDDAPKVAAMLGALKAGKSYVPMDPSLPASALVHILEDSGAVAVITDSDNLSLARDLRSEIQTININDMDVAFGDENLRLPIGPDHLAYILYTSGSSGRPKGVFQNHRNVLRKVRNYTNHSGLSPEDRLSLIVAFGFSAAVPNIFGALLNGASIFPFSLKDNGLAALSEWLIREEITICQSAVTVFRYATESMATKQEFPDLRLIDLFGEPLPAKDIERCRERFYQLPILRNRFASTETGDVCHYFIHGDTALPDEIVPAGYPVDGVHVQLIDRDQTDSGAPDVGEIAVKSPYLALGYWRDPALTAARFLNDPLGGGERVYLTGDIGWMSADGCLVHIGRKDFRVKVHGFRVETAEVERALADHPLVDQAAVVAQENQDRDTRLIAYFTTSANPAPPTTDLRSFLNQRLPQHMIPSIFISLETMPLAPNGKLDRRALPDPDTSRHRSAAPYVAPRAAVEERVAAVWAEVLGVDSVGIHDDFFELGGHSLLASRIAGRINAAFGVDLPVRSLLDLSTVAALAALIEVLTQTKKPSAPHASDPAGEETGEL